MLAHGFVLDGFYTGCSGGDGMMQPIHRIKKRLLVILMRILGFGGMAAYCMAGCTSQTPNSQSNAQQNEVVNPAVENDDPTVENDTAQAQNVDSPVAEDSQVQEESDSHAQVDSDSHAQNDSNVQVKQPTAFPTDNAFDAQAEPNKVLSDAELDELLSKHKYVKVNDYTTRIEKKEGMALTFTYIWAESKTGNKIRFPDTFKSIVKGPNGNYYAVFSDGTIDEIEKNFFDKIPSFDDDVQCDKKYSCGHMRSSFTNHYPSDYNTKRVHIAEQPN